MKYYLKYIQGNYVSSDAIHLDIGSILHKGLEIKYRNIIEGIDTDYDALILNIMEGIAEDTEKDKGNLIIGINSIKEKYGDNSFVEINEKSNLSYNDKLNTYFAYIKEDTLEDGWKPLAVEQDFEFVYADRCVLNGFIDRIDINDEGELRVVDYKSSNKLFEYKDLTTPLQMFIYALACEEIYGKRPIEYEYDMILLGEKQSACTKGYYNRGVKKLNKILDSIEESTVNGEWKPKATPLCYWCDYSNTNPNAPFYTSDLCDYYLLWEPNNKTFEKNKEFIVKSIDGLEF